MKSDLNKFIDALRKKNIKLCLAESISGGKLAYEIIKIKGASEIIDYSIVCYSDNSKRSILGIDKHLKKYGVFSEEVAEIMVKKVSKFSKSNNNLSISCTGQAGPNIITKKDDIGLVFIGINYKQQTVVSKKKFPTKNRLRIIEQTVKEMINLGSKIILN
ncbi:MAG: CinA family protein [Alphaproteobacteria bacterium]